MTEREQSSDDQGDRSEPQGGRSRRDEQQDDPSPANGQDGPSPANRQDGPPPRETQPRNDRPQRSGPQQNNQPQRGGPANQGTEQGGQQRQQGGQPPQQGGQQRQQGGQPPQQSGPPPQGSQRGGPPASDASAGTHQSPTDSGQSIDDTRWKIGWSPGVTVIGALIAGAVIGVLIDAPAIMAVLGLVAGLAVWLWGQREVNENYRTLLENFRDASRLKVERSIGGLNVSSMHTFISSSGGSPMLIEPARAYSATHMLFGDTSVVINREYEYDIKERRTLQGGEQRELFYDQISNVKTDSYANFAELDITLSSGDRETIRSLNPSGLDDVKSDLQRRMRTARR